MSNREVWEVIKEQEKKMQPKINYQHGVTHAGIFHADDVFSTALLKILNPSIHIRRVFKADECPQDTIIYDIGMGKFDHHQKNIEIRDDGNPYAAFGLLWREFGHLILSDYQRLKFDNDFVRPIDKADNGLEHNQLTTIISSFVPNWNEEDQDMDAAFYKAVSFAKEILEREFSRIKAEEKAEKIILDAYKSAKEEIVVLEKFVPWQTTLERTNAEFIIFPSLRGGWNAQVIKQKNILPGWEDKPRVPFPKEWHGATEEELPEGVTFCHPSGFMLTANTWEDAINACYKAQSRNKYKN